LFLEVFGTKTGIAWNSEAPDELWIGERNSANRIVIKDPSLLLEKARPFADLPGGHSEGYDDTFKQTLRRFYRTVEDRGAAIEYPTFEDGLRQLKVLDTVLESARTNAWAEVGK
jgi:predicted dehydrogenase